MNENELWKAICDQESIELCKEYLLRFPSGLHVKEVGDKLKILERCNTIDLRFLKKYIQMGIVSLRGLLLAGLERQKVDYILQWQGITEEQLFQTARQQQSTAVIEDYLKFFPNGPHATELQVMKKCLEYDASQDICFSTMPRAIDSRAMEEEMRRKEEEMCKREEEVKHSSYENERHRVEKHEPMEMYYDCELDGQMNVVGSIEDCDLDGQMDVVGCIENYELDGQMDVESCIEEEMLLTDCMKEQLNSADKNVSSNIHVHQRKPGRLSKLMRLLKGTPKQTICNSALFAPAEISKGDEMLVQAYIYMDEEADSIARDAKRTDKEAVQRDYTPLNFPVQQGDMLTVRLDMHGLEIEGDSVQNVVWQGRYTKCCFWVPIPEDYGKMKVAGDVYISRNGLELGRMSFFSTIANHSNFNKPCTVDVRAYNKVFISYSHKDNDTVKVIAEAYKALGTVDYFFDRHTLAPGEFFEKKIYEYIDNCDLFILCWSRNAEKSEWVTKERERAFRGAIVVPARLRFYPININPKAAPPDDLKNFLHFEDYDTLLGMSANIDDSFC